MLRKKGQVENSTLVFIFVIIGLIIAAPLLLKLVGTFNTKLIEAANSSSLSVPESSITAVNSITNTYTDWMDSIIVIAFIANILLLFLTAYFIDVSWIFVVFYIIFAFITIVGGPYIYEVGIDMLYGPAGATGTWILANETLKLPMAAAILNNFGVIMVAIIILSGIIMYAKIKFGGPY